MREDKEEFAGRTGRTKGPKDKRIENESRRGRHDEYHFARIDGRGDHELS